MTRVRILTLNVWNLEGDPRRQAVINSELRRLAPDLVALQEVIADENRNQLEALLEGTGLHGSHQADVLPTTPPFADRYGGTALATRWPHRVVEALDLRVEGVHDVHPWGAVAAVVDVPDAGELLLVSTTNSPGIAEAARERQVVALSELEIRHRRALPSVIAGDLNAGPDAASIRFLSGLQSLGGQSARFHDAWVVAGDGPGLTWTAENPTARPPVGPGMRIDYVFVGSWRLHPKTECRFVNASLAFDRAFGDGIWASDHLGVLVDLDVAAAIST